MPSRPPNPSAANMIRLVCLSRTTSSTWPILSPFGLYTEVPLTLEARMAVVCPLAVVIDELPIRCEGERWCQGVRSHTSTDHDDLSTRSFWWVRFNPIGQHKGLDRAR